MSIVFSQYVFTAWWKIRSNFMSCRYCFWWWFPVSSDIQFHFLWPDKSIQLRKCSKVSCWLTSNPVAKCTPVAQLNHLFVACQLIHASNATSNLDPQISWWWWSPQLPPELLLNFLQVLPFPWMLRQWTQQVIWSVITFHGTFWNMNSSHWIDIEAAIKHLLRSTLRTAFWCHSM